MQNNLIPIVIESTGHGERSWDIYSMLLRQRIIFLGTPITDQTANVVIAQLLYLASEDNTKEISIYINSPGGSVSAGLAIYDTMQYLKAPISTICVGMAASMGAILLAGGTAGKRKALTHSKIMIHQPLGGTEGQASDIEIYTREMMRVRDDLYTILSKHTNKSIETIMADCDRNNYMTAQQALTYGLIDEIIL